MRNEAGAVTGSTEGPPDAEHPEGMAAQDSYIADLRNFFGPNADYYLKHYYDSQQNLATNKGTGFKINWIAAVAGVFWLFYRKLYWVGAGFLAFAFAVGWILPAFIQFTADKISIPLWVAVGAFANGLYVDRAKRFVLRANAQGLRGEAKRDYLKRAGGVSIAGLALGCAGIAAVLVLLLNLPLINPRLPECASAEVRKGLDQIVRDTLVRESRSNVKFAINKMAATVLRDDARACVAEVKIGSDLPFALTYEIAWLDKRQGRFEIKAWRPR